MNKKIYTKRCCKCHQHKPLSEYYKAKTKKDGYRYDCKTCHLINMKKYYQTERGKKVASKAVRHYQQTEKGKATKRIWEKRYSIRHPEYHKAGRTVQYAIKTGKLPRPNTLLCHYCPAQAEQYHHPSYKPEHWFNLEPICGKCHRKLRRKIA